MTTFLAWLRQQLDQITDAEGPDDPVAEGETVVGVIEDFDTKKLFVLRRRLYEESRRQAEQVIEQGLAELLKIFKGQGNICEDGTKCASNCRNCVAARESALLEERSKLVDSLFWADVKQSLPEEGLIALKKAGNTIAIRQGWTIVGFDEKPRVIHVLMGGGSPFPFGVPGGE